MWICLNKWFLKYSGLVIVGKAEVSLFMIVMRGVAFLSSWSAVIIHRSIFVISYTSKAGVFGRLALCHLSRFGQIRDESSRIRGLALSPAPKHPTHARSPLLHSGLECLGPDTFHSLWPHPTSPFPLWVWAHCRPFEWYVCVPYPPSLCCCPGRPYMLSLHQHLAKVIDSFTKSRCGTGLGNLSLHPNSSSCVTFDKYPSLSEP